MASEQEVILSLIQSCIEYLKEVYPNCSEEVLDDLIDLFGDVLQYFMLIVDNTLESLFQNLRGLLAALIFSRENRSHVVRRGRPEVNINQEQLPILWNKDLVLVIGE